MLIASANLNGIRSAYKKGFLDWLLHSKADVVAVQELKAQDGDLNDALRRPGNYHSYFHCAEKKGYSGVGLYCLREPDSLIKGLGLPQFDCEGRYLEARFGPLCIISLYLPSGSSSEERQQIKFKFMDAFWPHLATLAQRGEDVLLVGDWNIAHQEIDLKNWKANLNHSGFLPEERRWISQIFDQLGFVDVWRRLYPTIPGYTWWSHRGQAYAKDVGWRIDYHIATPAFAKTARTAFVYKDKKFSDHAPLLVEYG